MDNLIFVSVLDADLRQRRTRYDLKIALYGDFPRVDADLVQHSRDADPASNSAMFAIDSHFEAFIRAHPIGPIGEALTLANPV